MNGLNTADSITDFRCRKMVLTGLPVLCYNLPASAWAHLPGLPCDCTPWEDRFRFMQVPMDHSVLLILSNSMDIKTGARWIVTFSCVPIPICSILNIAFTR